MPEMLYFWAISWFSSTFNFKILALSPISLATSSIIGPNIWQGPHQGAQKSTNIGLLLCKTSSSKF